MRNLKLSHSRFWTDVEGLKHVTHLSVDYDTGSLYSCGLHSTLTTVDHQMGQITESVCLHENADIAPDAHVIAIQHVVELQGLVVAVSDGCLLVWNAVSNEVEEVGRMDGGIKAMAWSPDQELIIIVTGGDSVILMSREFDPITEVTIPSEGSTQETFVNVGWGKRETQFQGSVGKAAAHSAIEGIEAAPDTDDGRCSVSWRGDGQLFVVSSINTKTGGRQLTVWSREGTLQHVSENVNGLEHTLAWKPSGSLIVSTRRSTGRYEVVFFEKNGLRHGEFTLPFTGDQDMVRELLWNVDSTVLAVWCDTSASDSSKTSQVLLYTVNNHHWYLKQTLNFDQSVGCVCWHPEHVHTMHVVCNLGSLHTYTWTWSTNHSVGSSHMDLANVAVIDSNHVLVTPFRTMVVPPPYCAYKINTPTAVNQVSFGPPTRPNDVAMVTCDDVLLLYAYDPENTSTDPTIEQDCSGGVGFASKCHTQHRTHAIKLRDIVPESANHPLALSHLTYLDEKSLILIGPGTDGNHSVLYHLQLGDDKNDITLRVKLRVDGVVCNACLGNATMVLHTVDGKIWKYTTGCERIEPWTCDGLAITLPQMCTTIAVCTFAGQEAVVGLTERFRLYVNATEIASNCTSFAVHSSFLLLTTLSHTCRCISRSTPISDLPSLSDGKEHPFDESVRRVERGSRIVTVVTDDTKLVLQMPRGNLETIHPRALVLATVRSLLDSLCFGEAFAVMRKHRINLNLIHDHNPTMFMENITQFVTQLHNVGHINLFLSDLVPDDVTVTMYTSAYLEKRVNGGKLDKVDTICDAIQTAVTDVDQEKYLLSIITSHVRKTRPQLETVLTIIKSLPENTEEGHVNRADALTYALFLVDVNKLYDVALGMYDFDLVLMVAERSQKDPKEYLPFLNDLRRLEPDYQRFSIDKYLKRHEKALGHISKCSERFNECLTYIQDHSLYTQALSLFKHHSAQHREIATMYGEHLSATHKHEEAGIMFAKGDNWVRAAASFERCGNWRQALCASARLQLSGDEMTHLYLRLTKYLKEHKRHSEAAIVYEHYLKDVEEAIAALIEGCQWDEAQRLMHTHSRTDLTETHLTPHLITSHTSHLNTLATTVTDFVKYRDRLVIVREQKERVLQNELIDPEGDLYRGVDGDLYSDAASAMGDSVISSTISTNSQRSSYSKTSGRSSRNKRKAERKKWSLKENSPHEDLALMEALAKIVSYVNGIKEEVHSLLRALVMHDLDTEAESLQTELQAAEALLTQSMAPIWPPNAPTDSLNTVLGPESTVESVVRARQHGRQIQTTDSSIDTTPCQAPVISSTPWSLSILSRDKNT